jgi:hypothetical protein
MYTTVVQFLSVSLVSTLYYKFFRVSIKYVLSPSTLIVPVHSVQ